MTQQCMDHRFSRRYGWLLLKLAWAMGLILSDFSIAQAIPPRRKALPIEPRLEGCIRKAAAGRPWLEKTLWGLRDQEGGWVNARVPNSNGSFDLGPLQVNSWWVPHIARLINQPEPMVESWLTHDACFNADVARWIFISALRTTGDYWRAIGAYHSPTSWRQRRYAHEVAVRIQSRFGRYAFSGRDSAFAIPADFTQTSDRTTLHGSMIYGFGTATNTEMLCP